MVDDRAEMETLLELFARNVRTHMVAKKLSESVLASRAGIAQKTLNNMLKLRHAPQLDALVKVANGLGEEFWRLWLPDSAMQSNMRLIHQIAKAEIDDMPKLPAPKSP